MIPDTGPCLDTLIVRFHFKYGEIDDACGVLCDVIAAGELPPTITRLGLLSLQCGHWEQLLPALRSPTASTRRLTALQQNTNNRQGVEMGWRQWEQVGKALFVDKVCPSLETLVLRGNYGIGLAGPLIWPLEDGESELGWAHGPDEPQEGEEKNEDFQLEPETGSSDDEWESDASGDGAGSGDSGSENSSEDESGGIDGGDGSENESEGSEDAGKHTSAEPVPCIRELDWADCRLLGHDALTLLTRAMSCRPDSPLALLEKLDLDNNRIFSTSTEEENVDFVEAWAAAAAAAKDGSAGHLTHMAVYMEALKKPKKSYMPIIRGMKPHPPTTLTGRTTDVFLRAVAEQGVFPRLREVLVCGDLYLETAPEDIE